jgi:hypothetical protein
MLCTDPLVQTGSSKREPKSVAAIRHFAPLHTTPVLRVTTNHATTLMLI